MRVRRAFDWKINNLFVAEGDLVLTVAIVACRPIVPR